MRMKAGMMNTYNVKNSDEGEDNDEKFVRQMA